MSKIWMLKRGRKMKFFTNEESCLNNINTYSNPTVTVFESIEVYNALEYKKGVIEQRERHYQLSIILDDDEELSILNEIRKRLREYSVLDNDWRLKSILIKLENGGLSYSTFKRLMANKDLKVKLLTCCKTTEWYFLLLKCYNFTSIEVDSWRSKLSPSDEMIENFKKAKQLIKESKNKK